MLTGTMESQLHGKTRVWTLTIPAKPKPGELIEWNEPKLGSIPARSGVRGWVIDRPSSVYGTILVNVASESTRYVVLNVQSTDKATDTDTRYREDLGQLSSTIHDVFMGVHQLMNEYPSGGREWRELYAIANSIYAATQGVALGIERLDNFAKVPF